MWSNTKRVAKVKRQSLLLYFSLQSIKRDHFAIIQQSFNLLEQQQQKGIVLFTSDYNYIHPIYA